MNDEIFDALANEHRRQLLIALLRENPRDAIVERRPEEGNGDAGAVNPTQRLATVMYHNHLPRLEGHGFIRWNRDTHAVSKGPQFDEVRPLLEWLADHARSTPDLADSQGDLLRSAVQEGYFEVPRRVSLVELAEKHGISDREASERMRRGLAVAVHAACLGE